MREADLGPGDRRRRVGQVSPEPVIPGGKCHVAAEPAAAQGGDASVCDHPEALADAPIIAPVFAGRAGYVAHMDTAQLGYASQELGAGRKQKTDVIDPRVGFIMHCRVGDHLTENQPLCTVYAANQETLDRASAMIRQAITLSDAPVEKEKLLYALVTSEGVEAL